MYNLRFIILLLAGIILAQWQPAPAQTNALPDKQESLILQGQVKTLSGTVSTDQVQVSGQMHPLRIQRPPSASLPPSIAPLPPFNPRAMQFGLGSERVRLDTASFRVNTDRFKLSCDQFRILSRYQLELIVDRSMSMRRCDCPGGLSRWDWCGYQAVDVDRGLSPYLKEGLTITRFATDFDVHEHVSAPALVDILSRHDFQFGTRLCEPLEARLNRFFASHRRGQKPLLIAVITDGRPWPRPESFMVRQALINASQKMTDSGEVTVVFFQIGGDDPRGRRYLLSLEYGIMHSGARFPYVHTKTFEELQEIGLARALVDVVSSNATAFHQ